MGVAKRPFYGGFHGGTVLPNFRMTRATIQYLLEPHDKAVTAHRKAVTGVTRPVITHVLDLRPHMKVAHTKLEKIQCGKIRSVSRVQKNQIWATVAL